MGLSASGIILVVIISAFAAAALSLQRKTLSSAHQDLVLSGLALAVGGLGGVVLAAAFLLWQLLAVHKM